MFLMVVNNLPHKKPVIKQICLELLLVTVSKPANIKYPPNTSFYLPWEVSLTLSVKLDSGSHYGIRTTASITFQPT